MMAFVTLSKGRPHMLFPTQERAWEHFIVCDKKEKCNDEHPVIVCPTMIKESLKNDK